MLILFYFYFLSFCVFEVIWDLNNQRGNPKSQIEEGQELQWPTEKEQTAR
jgi:hypothetical protein